jgi:hypothetical protein
LDVLFFVGVAPCALYVDDLWEILYEKLILFAACVVGVLLNNHVYWGVTVLGVLFWQQKMDA